MYEAIHALAGIGSYNHPERKHSCALAGDTGVLQIDRRGGFSEIACRLMLALLPHR